MTETVKIEFADSDAVEKDLEALKNSDVMELEKFEDEKTRQASLQILADFQRRQRARHINISTDDDDVRLTLRRLGEPVTLFGEGPADRRCRLQEILSKMESSTAKAVTEQHIAMQQAQKWLNATTEDLNTETWYHPGPDDLLAARKFIVDYSIPRAADRIFSAKKLAANETVITKQARQHDISTTLQSATLACSQIGDSRPLTYASFSPDADLVATTSRSGLVKVWSVPECKLERTMVGHEMDSTCVEFHPETRISLDDSACCLASCARDGDVKLWSLDSSEPLADIEGHAPYRVSRLAFHPSGRFLGTACFDHSWRLWDLQVQDEILHQEGHSRPVYDLAFHPDGSLVATASLDCYCRVWDLRSGRCVLLFEGHLKPILAVDIASNGYLVATGGQDNSVRLWDLRKRACVYTLPAHTDMISKLKFRDSHFLASASYDRCVKLWSVPSMTAIRNLEGHVDKILGVDVSKHSLVSASYDRTFKLFTWN